MNQAKLAAADDVILNNLNRLAGSSTANLRNSAIYIRERAVFLTTVTHAADYQSILRDEAGNVKQRIANDIKDTAEASDDFLMGSALALLDTVTRFLVVAV